LLLEIRSLHIITGRLKTKAASFPSRKQSPRKFLSNADCPVFLDCGRKVKPYQLLQP
jgi:hypothetical protein